MPLEIQRGRSKWWYGRLAVNGKEVFQNLNVLIEGIPPASLRDEGNAAFERSRAKAQVALEEWKAKLVGKAHKEEFYQKILEIRTGERMRSVPLDKMAERWQALPRRRALAPRYETQCVVDITKFVQFVKRHNPKTEEMAAVTDEMVRAFMKAEETRGVSPKRYNEVLKLLRSCFGNLRKEAGLATDPVEGNNGAQ